LNGDNKPDLVVIDNANLGFVSILINNGDGTFAAPVTYAVGANPTSSFMYLPVLPALVGHWQEGDEGREKNRPRGRAAGDVAG
jgi:hypothetical protein